MYWIKVFFTLFIVTVSSSCRDDDPVFEQPRDYRQMEVEAVAKQDKISSKDADKEVDKREDDRVRIAELRQADPSLNWVNIGITTGKFSESLGSSVHRTYLECFERDWMEDNECFPIAALPQSYWDAETGE